MKTEEQLRKIAADFYDGLIYSDRHVASQNVLQIVFMPLALGALSQLTEAEVADIGLIYEYWSEYKSPRSINGSPIFFSMKILTKEETEKMLEYSDEYKAVKEQFLKKTPE